MATPTSYRFTKNANGTVLIHEYVGADIQNTYGVQAGRDLRQNTGLPDQVVIPIKVYFAQGNNTFISVPFGKIDLVNSTPSGTNPTSAQGAIEALMEDFFFDVSGGGGGVGTLQQVTDAGDTTTNDIVMNGGNLILADDSIVQFNNATGPFFTSIVNSQVTANQQAQLPNASGSVALITGPVNTNPADVTVEVKIPIAIIDGTVYYVMASTNNT